METDKEGMTRREFLKGNAIMLVALAFLGLSLKSFAGVLRRQQPRDPNVSDKEGRYYRRLAG